MDEELMELFNGLDDVVKDLLLVENPDGTFKINGSNFKTALSKSIGDERDIVCEIFLRHSIATDTEKWKGVTWDKLEPYKDIIIRICRELGFSEVENPFLVFLPEFYRKNRNFNLTRDNMIDLNNLYATNDLTDADLIGKGRAGTDNIIFNPNLYANSDIDKMVKYWNWLFDANNLFRMNWEQIREANLTNAINDVAEEINTKILDGEWKSASDISDVKKYEFLDKLYFVTGDNRSKTNSQNTLEKLFAAGSIARNQQQNMDTASKTKMTNLNVLDTLKNTIIKAGKDFKLTEVELKALFADALDELGL